MVGNCPTQWLSKLQTKIAVSTMEAEHIALITAMYDLIPLQTLMDKVEELLCTKSLPSCTNSEILEDNNGALILATSPWMTHQSKHIAIKHHFLKDCVQQSQGMTHLVKVNSEDQFVHCMMKGLEKTKFHWVRKMLQVGEFLTRCLIHSNRILPMISIVSCSPLSSCLQA